MSEVSQRVLKEAHILCARSNRGSLSTTDTAKDLQWLVDEETKKLTAELAEVKRENERVKQAIISAAERAYCDGIRMATYDHRCLGWEAKVKCGEFTEANMQAHEQMNKLFGKHYGLMEVYKSIYPPKDT